MVSDDKKAIDSVFLSVLGRKPNSTEAEKLCQHICGKFGDDRVKAISDIYWAMMNSTEFAWNH